MRKVALSCAALLFSGLASAQSADDEVPKAAQPPDESTAQPAPADSGSPPSAETGSTGAPTAAAPLAPSAPESSAPRPKPTADEPPLPGPEYGPAAYEPPPPPRPHHSAPRTALWFGARLGWFLPFGNLWAKAEPAGSYYVLTGVPWTDYAASGAMLEGDVGMRLGRNYNLFFGWERAWLGAGNAETALHGTQQGGDSDFWGIGLRANSDPDRIGFVSEVMIGYRRARARWADGTEIQFTDAPFEARLGLGAEFRLNSSLTLSPLLTLGAGAFGTVRYVDANGNSTSALGPIDEGAGHGWLTLQIGGHFDLGGSG